ncbi:hypothetical protein Goshw_024269 [Gossypium schwendimanii]|uniref:RNase H type-1 domain-containing protein n=1 Tax=Gossypium schwendimanii TaxID=34291 RepID=A0A7J9M6M5_GOSSC|nr:hypothetical protein [Gossypium schwendimanii]
MLKCNVDGATFVDNEHVGWVAIVHNDVGGFIRCILGFMNSSSDPFMAEILTVREALFWLRSLHLDGVIMKIGFNLSTSIEFERMLIRLLMHCCPSYIVGIVSAERLANMNVNEGS